MGRTTASALVAVLAAPLIITMATSSPVVAAPVDVVINEIMYHPEDDRPDGEFVELFNTGGTDVDLSGWCVDGVKFCFPDGVSIEDGGYLVTRASEWDGGLSNGGEDIALLDRAGDAIDALEYDDKGQWPANTDGNGASLQRIDPASPASDPGNWWGATETAGRRNAEVGTSMPVWDDVENTVLPAPGEPIVVAAEVDDAVSAELFYRIGFGGEVRVPATVEDGVVRTEIPGQADGALVRYRLRAVSAEGREGTWPRQGDGSTYAGTTVAASESSDLPRFEWFMPDDVYERAVNDLTLRGDDGYPAVFAYDGVVFDNTKVRVKGRSSRTWPKKKWKFVLPDGHDLEIDGVLYDDVDEFALHSGWSDKSFLREILSAEFMERAGVPTSQAFPMQLERNGEFYGLYTYVEQRDGTFRDRQGFDDATVYEVGGDNGFGDMAPEHADLSTAELRSRYDKDTREFEDDDALRELIRGVDGSPAEVRTYVDEHVDTGSLINAIAAIVVAQHGDIGYSNYDLVLNEQGLWEVYPTDFDLSFGRTTFFDCGNLCEFVWVLPGIERPTQPLFAAFWADPELAALVRQRIRTLAEEELAPAGIDARVEELRDLLDPTADLDRTIWGTYGEQQSPDAAMTELIDDFVVPQHTRLLGELVDEGLIPATSQPAIPALEITDVVDTEVDGVPPHVRITNRSDGLVDLSGFEIPELDVRVRGGTFLAPGQSAVAVDDDLGVLGDLFSCCVFAGRYGEDLDNVDEFTLTNRDGATVAVWPADDSETDPPDPTDPPVVVPPRGYHEFSGRPGRSAFVSIAAVAASGYGYLQVLDCSEDAGGTSNLTYDRVGQTRAGVAIVEFDDDGRLCVYNSTPTEVIVDIQGYLADDAIDDIVDVRLIDTRRDGDKRATGSVTRITGRPDTSAVVSLAAVQAEGRGYLQVLPCDAAPGAYSILNTDRPQQNRTGLAVVRFDPTGTACVFNSMATHVLADLQGYLSDDAIDDVDDVRLVDTRLAGGKPASGSQTLITGRPGESAVISIVSVQTSARGYVQVLPCGTRPGASSNVNSDQAGQNVSNLAVVQFDSAGRACVFVQESSHLVVDLQGYFADGAFDDIADVRVLDTRLD